MIFYNVPEKNLWIISLIVTHRTLNCTLRRNCTERMPATRQRTPATIARRKKFLLTDKNMFFQNIKKYLH